MAVQCACGFICQQESGIVDDRPCTGAALFLAAGYLIGIFVQDITDI